MADDGAPGTWEEVRLACVFNGGVSLAVWMGGVAHEINELTRGAAGYGPLLELLRVRARADVISGTSAGGINGAALALAQVNRATDLADLRRVWAEQGRLETLLNRPFTGNPSSLLRGEEVFLPELTRALHQLATPWLPHPADERPIDLTVTTTLLDGVTVQETDSFGQRLGQDRHDVHFRFRRLADGAGDPRDDFCAPVDAGRPPVPKDRVIDALGLAARASAGFPVAFEPTLIPVDPRDEAPDRPDMAPYASWRAPPGTGTGGRRSDRSRYAVDGGLLNNTPTQHALAAIQQMPAGHVVDRVLMLVIPLRSGEAKDTGAAGAPTVTRMALGLATSLTSTGSRSFVDDVVRHNRKATALRGTRCDVLATAFAGVPDHDDAAAADALAATAGQLFPHYRRLRRRRDTRDLAAGVELPAGCSYEQVRADLEAVEEERDTSRAATVPGTLAELVGALAPGRRWTWGGKPLLDIGDAALEYLAHLVAAWPASADRQPLYAARGGVHAALSRVRRVRRALDAPWELSPHLTVLPPDRPYWRLRLAADAWFLGGTAAAWDDVTGAAAQLGVDPAVALAPAVAALGADGAGPRAVERAGGRAGDALGRALDTMVSAFVAPAREPVALGLAELTGPLSIEGRWRPLLRAAAGSAPADARALVARMLGWLHVASWTIGDELPTENTNPIRFLQVSAATPNDFAVYSRTVQERLGGASLARFSGFLKRSWRMNDWTWGRLDGATSLVRVLLTARRVRELAAGLDGPEEVVDLLLRTVWGPAAAAALSSGSPALPADQRTALVALRDRAVAEVTRVLGEPATPDSGALPELAALLSYGRHVHIVHEELPELAAAITQDEHDGANRRSRGRLFLTQHDPLLRELEETRSAPGTDRWLGHGLEALAVFDRAGIGREPLDEESTSDQMIRTAVTAAGVAATVAAGDRSGLGAIAPVTRAVKGLTMLPYWVTRGLTAGGGLARLLGLLGLAFGGVLLVLALLGVLTGPLAGTLAVLGAGALVTVLVYAALRTGSHLHGTVLVVLAAVLLAAGAGGIGERWQPGPGTGAIVGALLVVGGLVGLGSLREPMVSPKVLVEDGSERFARAVASGGWVDRRLRWVRGVGLGVVTVAVAALIAVLVGAGVARPDRLPAWLAGDVLAARLPWVRGAVVVSLAAVVSGVALLAGHRLGRAAAASVARRRSPPAARRQEDLVLGAVMLAVTLPLALVAAAVVRAVDTRLEPSLARVGRWVAGPWAPPLIGLGAVVLLTAITLGVLLAGRGLRRWQRTGRTWQLERGSGPAGVAAGWSVVYGGAALLAAALALLWWPADGTDRPGGFDPWSAPSVVSGLVVLALVLMVPVPLLMLGRAHGTVRRRVARALDREEDVPVDAGRPARQAAWLEANGWAYSTAVRRMGDHLELREGVS